MVEDTFILLSRFTTFFNIFSSSLHLLISYFLLARWTVQHFLPSLSGITFFYPWSSQSVLIIWSFSSSPIRLHLIFLISFSIHLWCLSYIFVRVATPLPSSSTGACTRTNPSSLANPAPDPEMALRVRLHKLSSHTLLDNIG